MRKKITSLTDEQTARLAEIRDEWIEIGLATGPADRQATESAVAEAYRVAGLEPPKIFIWVDSPLAGVYAQAMISTLKVQEQVQEQVRAQVWAQVREQVGEQVMDQVVPQVWGQVWDQVWRQVWGQVEDQVMTQVVRQVEDQVWSQVVGQVRDQVLDQVNNDK